MALPTLVWGGLTIPAATSVNSTSAPAARRQLAVAGNRSVVPLVYGEDRIGALLLNVLQAGTNSPTLLVQCLWAFASDAVADVLLNDLALPAGATVTTYTGAQTTADPALVAAFAAQGITYSQTLAGYCYSVIAMPTRAFDGQLNITARVRGRRVYDPRKDTTNGGSGAHRLATPSTWEWSDVPALCLADFCASAVYGAGAAVDWATVRAAANANDTLIGTPAERHRTVGVSFTSPSEVAEVGETLRAYAGCFILPGANGIRLLPDANDAPAASYAHAAGQIADIEPLTLRDLGSVPTVVEVIYTDRTQVPWRDDTATAALPGAGTTRPYRLSQVRLPGVHRYSQARREAIERLNKLTLNDSGTAVEIFDVGLRHDVGDIITVTHPIGLNSAAMRVIGLDMPAHGRWRLQLARHAASAYSTAVEARGTPVGPSLIIPRGAAGDVANLAGLPGGGRILWAWEPRADGLSTELRLGGTSWETGTFLFRGAVSNYSQTVTTTGTYTLRAKHVDDRGNYSAGTALATTVVGAGDLVATGASGPYTDFIFQRSAAQPATPTGDNPAGWFGAPPAANGQALWVSIGDKTAAGVLVGTWSAPVQIDGESLQVEYSVDGSTLWHVTFAPGDIFARYRVGTTAAWSAAVRIVGENGLSTDYIFQRSATAPARPAGNAPAGWFDAPPTPNGLPLWASLGDRKLDGSLVGLWSVPVQIEGDSLFVEYSANGVDGWHPVFVAATDIFARYKTGINGAWSDSVKIVGEDGASAPLLRLQSTGFAFVFEDAAATTTTSPTITLSAQLVNLTGTATFDARAFNAAGTQLGEPITLGGTGNSRTLTGVQFNSRGALTTAYVRVTITLGSLTDSMTIFRGNGGDDVIRARLTNEAHTLPASNAGLVASYAGASGTMEVFKGLTRLTDATTPSVAFALAPSGNPQGLTFTIDAATGSYAVTAMPNAPDVATLTIRATVTGGLTLDSVFTVTKSKAGQIGQTGQTGQPGAPGEPGPTGGTGATGAAGKSVLIAYALYTGNPVMSGASVTKPGQTLPAVADFTPTAATAFTLTTQNPGVGQAMFQSMGIHDPTVPETVWARPFLSNLRVGNLSAISADIGTITAGSINTTGFLKAEGNSGVMLNDPSTVANVSKTICVVGNTSFASDIGVVGLSNRAGNPGVYGFNATAGGVGTFGYGASAGVWGKPVGAGSGVQGNAAAVSTSKGVYGISNGAGTTGVYGVTSGGGVGVFADGGGGGTALRVDGGPAVFLTQIQSTVASGTAPLTVISSTQVANLNAQFLGGNDGTFYRNGANINGAVGSATNATNATNHSGQVTGGQITGLLEYSGGAVSLLRKPGTFSGGQDWFVGNFIGIPYTFPIWRMT